PKASPKQIDFLDMAMLVGGEIKSSGGSMLGIYEIKDGVWKLAYSWESRPSDFSPAKDKIVMHLKPGPGPTPIPEYTRKDDFPVIVTGAYNYDLAHRRLPGDRYDADKQPLLSWRTSIINFIANRYDFDVKKRWDDPAN